MKRRTFVRGLGAGIALGPAAFSESAAKALGPEAANPHLTRIHPQFLITAKEAQAWHVAKDSLGGPTLAGSPSWKNFLEITERELRARGVKDVIRNAWTYDRWFTSDWPDDTNWTLTIDGKKIRVASYGANSGMTRAAGATDTLVAYRQGMSREALKGKIVVIPPGPCAVCREVSGAAPVREPVWAITNISPTPRRFQIRWFRIPPAAAQAHLAG